MLSYECYTAHDPPQFGSMTAFQVWVGNIPIGTSEADASSDFTRCGFARPFLLKLRRGEGKNAVFGIATFKYESDAMSLLQAPHGALSWWNGKYAVVRRVWTRFTRQTIFVFKTTCF